MPDIRATQDAVAEQSAIRHVQQWHLCKLEGNSMLEGVVPPFLTYNSGLRVNLQFRVTGYIRPGLAPGYVPLKNDSFG
jgi:hypothetical protein